MSDDDVRVPIGDAFPGLLMKPMEGNLTPLAAVIFVKTLDMEDGQECWVIHKSNDFSDAECIGAGHIIAAWATDAVIQGMRDDD